MTDRSVTHATFVIQRRYDASPTRVFNAWADPAVKTRWFGGPPEHAPDEYELDFRVGGRELSRGDMPDGPSYVYEARYHDIVPDRRIVSTYDLHLDGARISVSLATVELVPDGDGTRLIYTEQGAFFDGRDIPEQREDGSRELLEALDAELQRQAVSA